MKKQDLIAELEELMKLDAVSKQEFYDYNNKDYYTVFVLDFCTFSDYSGTCVERANNKYFKEKYSFIGEEYGGYGTVWTGINPNELIDESDKYNEFTEEYSSLLEYPVIDDELHSEMEFEAEVEAWDSWAKDDFVSLLDKKFENELEEYGCIDLEEYFEKCCKENNIDINFDDFVSALFEQARQDTNEHWTIEVGGSAWIDIENIANSIAWHNIETLLEKGRSK